MNHHYFKLDGLSWKILLIDNVISINSGYPYVREREIINNKVIWKDFDGIDNNLSFIVKQYIGRFVKMRAFL